MLEVVVESSESNESFGFVYLFIFGLVSKLTPALQNMWLFWYIKMCLVSYATASLARIHLANVVLPFYMILSVNLSVPLFIFTCYN